MDLDSRHGDQTILKTILKAIWPLLLPGLMPLVTMVFVVTPTMTAFLEMVFVPVFPVAFVLIIVAVPERRLVKLAAVLGILVTILAMVPVSILLVNGHFMHTVQIVLAILFWQYGRTNPMPVMQVDELVCRNIVVHVHVRDIIILCVVISLRSPGWLVTDIHVDLDLCPKGVARQKPGKQDQSSCYDFFHFTFFSWYWYQNKRNAAFAGQDIGRSWNPEPPVWPINILSAF